MNNNNTQQIPNNTNNIFNTPIDVLDNNEERIDYKIPDSVYDAVCIGLADMGNVPVTFNNQTKMQHKIQIAFALNYQFADGQYAVLTQRYTLSLYKSTLAKMLSSWKIPYNTLTDLLGKSCQIVVSTSADGKYSNILNILQPKVKLNVPPVYLPSYWFTKNFNFVAATGVLQGSRPVKSQQNQPVVNTAQVNNKAVIPSTRVQNAINKQQQIQPITAQPVIVQTITETSAETLDEMMQHNTETTDDLPF